MYKLSILIFFTSIDLLAKFLVSNNLSLNETIKINKYFEISYIQNFGVSFGMFSDIFPYWAFVLIGILVSLLIFYLMKNTKIKKERWAYFIILIGACSNIIDRGINGYVVDFISIHYEELYWPTFNLADIYITLGIMMLLFSFFRGSKIDD